MRWRPSCFSCSSAAMKCATLRRWTCFARAPCADYLFDKDLLFARLNLNDEEFALYQQIYRSLQLQAPVPDLVIYLQAAPETLVERVQRRAQPYESGIAKVICCGCHKATAISSIITMRRRC